MNVRARLVALAAVAGLDLGTTLFGFSIGLRETAPVAATLVLALGWWTVIPFKMGLMLVALWMLRRVETDLAWALAISISVVPVVSNFLLIQGT